MEAFTWTFNRMFSRDVTAAMLVSLNNGTAAMLLYSSRRIRARLSCKCFLLFAWKNKVTDHVSENTLYEVSRQVKVLLGHVMCLS